MCCVRYLSPIYVHRCSYIVESVVIRLWPRFAGVGAIYVKSAVAWAFTGKAVGLSRPSRFVLAFDHGTFVVLPARPSLSSQRSLYNCFFKALAILSVLTYVSAGVLARVGLYRRGPRTNS